MAAYGEWNRKGATLSDVTAKAEYGMSRDFIVKGIQTGKLEYREGSIWGNPYLRVSISQSLEKSAGELHCGGTWRGCLAQSQEPNRVAQGQKRDIRSPEETQGASRAQE
jgi:hypothetical protein